MQLVEDGLCVAVEDSAPESEGPGEMKRVGVNADAVGRLLRSVGEQFVREVAGRASVGASSVVVRATTS